MKHSTLLVPFVAVALLAPAFAAKPAAKSSAVTSLDETIKAAKEGKKLAFIQFGRESCENCQHLRQLIKAGSISIPGAKFVYADLNCDDRATSLAFKAKFTVSGNGLPFVVVMDSEGRQLASRSGYGEAKDYAALLTEAAKKAKTLPAAVAAK